MLESVKLRGATLLYGVDRENMRKSELDVAPVQHFRVESRR
jgi:hypothetical protein